MTKPFAITFLIGLVVVGAAIWTVFYKQAGAHIDPKGSILKVRTLKLDDKSSAAVVEIRLANDSDYPVVARTIEMSAVTGQGPVDGNAVAEGDVKDLFKNYPILGEQYNPVMKIRDKVPPHSSIDREVCAQFEVPIEDLDRRKDLIVRVEDISGPTAELHEKPVRR
jgi:hypothetical protein